MLIEYQMKQHFTIAVKLEENFKVLKIHFKVMTFASKSAQHEHVLIW